MKIIVFLTFCTLFVGIMASDDALSHSDFKPDFSNVTDEVPLELQNKFQALVQNGFGESVTQLSGIYKKMQIIKAIKKAQWKKNNGDKPYPEKAPSSNDSGTAELLYEGDMFMREEQLDNIIQGAAKSLGVTDVELAKLGVKISKTTED